MYLTKQYIFQAYDRPIINCICKTGDRTNSIKTRTRMSSEDLYARAVSIYGMKVNMCVREKGLHKIVN